MKINHLIVFIVLFLLLSINSQARPIPSEDSLNSTFHKFRDVIRVSCNNEYPTNDNKFQKCTSTRDKSMVWFFTTFWKFRDSKGINSIEFKKGIDCVEQHSPSVDEPGRKKALELVDWMKLKNCYQNSLAE